MHYCLLRPRMFQLQIIAFCLQKKKMNGHCVSGLPFLFLKVTELRTFCSYAIEKRRKPDPSLHLTTVNASDHPTGGVITVTILGLNFPDYSATHLCQSTCLWKPRLISHQIQLKGTWCNFTSQWSQISVPENLTDGWFILLWMALELSGIRTTDEPNSVISTTYAPWTELWDHAGEHSDRCLHIDLFRYRLGKHAPPARIPKITNYKAYMTKSLCIPTQ